MIQLGLALGALAVDGTSNSISEASCDCYLTNGTVPTYLSGHFFFDFRDLKEYAGVPALVNNLTLSALAPPSSDYFKNDDWTNAWDIQTWNNSGSGGVSLGGDAGVFMVNSPSNIYIAENGDKNASSRTHLTMRTVRFADFQSAAEFESVATYQFLSLRMLARVTGSPGACAAMFTYRGSEELSKVQEADIEIMTRDAPDRIQYTNQPSFSDEQDDIPEATHNATLPAGLTWDTWAVHRLDWTPARSVWSVEGQEVANIAFQTPKDPAQVFFNMWSDGGSWSGNMSVGGAAYMDIQWIEMVYNGTDEKAAEKRSVAPSRSDVGPGGRLLRRKGDDDKCKVVCSIDERDAVGTSKMLWNSTTTENAAPRGPTTSSQAWIAPWILGVTALLWFV